MANFSHLFLFIALLNFVPFSVGTDHIVGDERGWNLGVDFSSWTIGKTFFVGDSLVFRYKKGLHNVFDVNVSAFGVCAAPTNVPPMESGNDVVRLLRPGTRWFLCSIAHHCNSGQKLVIFVDIPPAPPPANSTQLVPPPSSLPPTPVPALPPPTTAAPPPSVQSPGQNQTKPHLPVPTPTPSESIPPSSNSPVIVPTPSATAPPPSGAASKSSISSHLGVLAVAIGFLAGIMT